MSQSMPDFVVKDGKRFSGDFVVERAAAVPPEPTPQQDAYLHSLSDLLDSLAKLDQTQPRFEERSELRARVVKSLHTDAENFAEQRIDPTKAYENVLIGKGRFEQGADNLCDTDCIKVVLEPPEANDPEAHARATGIVELIPDGVHLTEDHIKVIDALSMTQTVLSAVRRNQKSKLGDTKSDRADKVLDTYLRRLAGIGHVGLIHDAKLGLAQIDALQRDYLTVEAPRIKYRYLKYLCWISACVFVVSMVAYLALSFGLGNNLQGAPLTLKVAAYPLITITLNLGLSHSDFMTVLHGHKEFFLFTAGAAVGTSLSFAARDQNLAFADLASLGGNFTGSFFLVLFATGFTGVVWLLFRTEAVSIGLGQLSSGNIITQGSVALLIGVFCGLSERALATSVAGRAAAFMQGVGGKA